MSIRIITKRGNELGSLPSFSKAVKVAYVGESYGEIIYVKPRTIEVQNTNFTYYDATTYQSTDFTLWVINNDYSGFDLDAIYEDPYDTFNTYIKDTDWYYEYDSVLGPVIRFTNNPIPPPELEVEVLESGGSGLNGRQYNYKIVAYGHDGTSATTSLSANVVVPSSSNTDIKHKFSWNKVPHAEGYIIYDSTANRRLTIIANPNTTSFIRSSGTSGTSVTLPTSGTAFRKPSTNTELYFDYHYTDFNYSVKNFTSLNAVQKKHGIGSPLTNMARIAFQYYNVPELYLCATDGTTNQKFIDAIDKLKNIEEIQYVTALKNTDTVTNYVVTHATNQSTDDEQKERFGVIHIPNTITEVGDETTSGTIRYRLASFLDNKRAIIVVPNGNTIYMNSFQEADGSFTDNKLVDNYYVAGAISALCVVADDVATSIMGKELLGFNYGVDGPPWIDSVEQDKIESSGGLYIKSKTGRPVVYNDNTNDTSMTENFERSVLSAEDEMRRRLRTSHSQYLGRKITEGLIEAIYSTTSSVLKDMVSALLINSFNASSLEVKQDDVIKTKVNVVFTYAPIYPLKELVFTYSFDL